MKPLQEFYDPADMTICVPAETPLGDLHRRIAADDLRFPLGVASAMSVGDLYLYRRWVATSLRFGSIADNVLGMTWKLGNGKSVQLGSRVVKNVVGFDLMRFLCQSHGRLGVPQLMVLRLRPLGQRLEGVQSDGPLETLEALQSKILHSSWAHAIDACLLVIRADRCFLWTPFSADKSQAGLIQAWLETCAKDFGLQSHCRPAAPPNTLDDYQVQIQALPSTCGTLAGNLVKRFGGRALVMGGLGMIEYAPVLALEGPLLEELTILRQALIKQGGHVQAAPLKALPDGPEALFEKNLKKMWEALE